MTEQEFLERYASEIVRDAEIVRNLERQARWDRRLTILQSGVLVVASLAVTAGAIRAQRAAYVLVAVGAYWVGYFVRAVTSR